ncbi:MAG: TonB-dependent receptor plug domain-containing protein, partial [bacterium]
MATHKIPKCFIFILILLFLPIFAFSQNEVWRYYEVKDTLIVEAEKVTQIPSYSTMVSKIPIALQHTPASVGVVLKSQFDSQHAPILSDALKNISGVNIQSNFGVHDYFMIRGFNSLGNGLILTDGTIETESTFYNLYNIERIEVLKGPGAFLYGGNPLSGTVNLWRKQPIYRNFLD